VCTREDAARVFGVSKAAVDHFLRIWDSLSRRDDASCTALLVAAIEEIDGAVTREFIIGSTGDAAAIGEIQLGPISEMEVASDEEPRELLGQDRSV
jgi:hypothetical protein